MTFSFDMFVSLKVVSCSLLACVSPNYLRFKSLQRFAVVALNFAASIIQSIWRSVSIGWFFSWSSGRFLAVCLVAADRLLDLWWLRHRGCYVIAGVGCAVFGKCRVFLLRPLRGGRAQSFQDLRVSFAWLCLE